VGACLTIKGVFFNTHILFGRKSITYKKMEKAEDSSNGQVSKRIIKGQRGISLRACVAKSAGWTLEKANAPPIHEASINKMI